MESFIHINTHFFLNSNDNIHGPCGHWKTFQQPFLCLFERRIGVTGPVQIWGMVRSDCTKYRCEWGQMFLVIRSLRSLVEVLWDACVHITFPVWMAMHPDASWTTKCLVTNCSLQAHSATLLIYVMGWVFLSVGWFLVVHNLAVLQTV